MQPPYQAGWVVRRLVDFRRRLVWLLPGLTVRKAFNLLMAGGEFLLRRERMRAWPVIVKIDISPLCNLRCTVCVHARPGPASATELSDQRFAPDAFMTVDQFARIIREIAGNTIAVSLYYIGDPLMHPDLDQMCRIAHDTGVNSHISTNFSFRLTDERLESIVESGLTNLTVCIDGFSQETYSRTRVGGQIALVLSNLERVLLCRTRLKKAFPRIEVQYLKYQHNLHELEDARARCAGIGVDQFSELWGDLHNYTDMSPGQVAVTGPKKNRAVPQCLWPHFALDIKRDGDVIPCVNYRMGPQHTPGGEKRVLGNVYDTSVREVWNSGRYQALRRLVSRPERLNREPELSTTFCDGCPQVFDTAIEQNLRRGSAHRWEDLYRRDERGRVERIQR